MHTIPTILRWTSVAAATTSATWIVLLAALVVRCQSSNQPFPALAKLSPFRGHLRLIDQWGRLFPVFALIAAVLIALAWYRERNFRSVLPATIASATLLLLSPLVVLLDPGGYFSWFLS